MTDIQQILRILPHRYPFVMVDRVIECEADRRIVALKNVTINEPYFVGHFPGQPVMPGVLIIEALAQTGALLAHASEAFDPARHLIYFAAMDRVKFRRPVRPGDQLSLRVEALRAHGRIWKLRGEAVVDDQIAAEGEFLASIVDRDAPAPA